ncbi:MAG TPA: DUF2889 domain-containing protein [Porticoccaceae bacterium]
MTTPCGTPVDELPGFRRRFRISPEPGQIRAEVEDDFHCMAVELRHDGRVILGVEPAMHRAPWTTCPGAEEKLRQTFLGVALKAIAQRGEKQDNCTHLYDLVLLAASHADDTETLVYDILVSDPVNGERRAEIRGNGTPLIGWTEAGFRLVSPEPLAGASLAHLRAWIDFFDPRHHEAARLLRWANMIANGRVIPLEDQSDASKMPPNCYTFQPHRAAGARRVGIIRDFSTGESQPLEQ